jgi:hypothetical protein
MSSLESLQAGSDGQSVGLWEEARMAPSSLSPTHLLWGSSVSDIISKELVTSSTMMLSATWEALGPVHAEKEDYTSG